MAMDYYVAWWNVENLFDIVGQTEPDRPCYLQKELKRELKGWTKKVLQKKIEQLASIIKKMNHDSGPDILGLCEIENRNVIEQLAKAIEVKGRAYRIIHHDMSDKRGIDIAFIFDSKKFKEKSKSQFSHVVQMHKATRDLFQASLITKKRGEQVGGNEIVLVGNHWPSRIGDDNEFWRLAAASTLGYWINRIHDVLGKKVAILVMGDFNDEPFSDSLVKCALAVQQKEKVTSARTKNYLWNAMWELMGKGKTSYVYSGKPNMLDQFLLSKGLLLRDAPVQYVSGTVDVLRYPPMISGKYSAPKRFGRPSKKKFYNCNGYSDHFPIVLTLRET